MIHTNTMEGGSVGRGWGDGDGCYRGRDEDMM